MRYEPPRISSGHAALPTNAGSVREPRSRLRWEPPSVDALPPLAQLTLVTPEVSEEDSLGDGIQGNMSSVFPDPI